MYLEETKKTELQALPQLLEVYGFEVVKTKNLLHAIVSVILPNMRNVVTNVCLCRTLVDCDL
jgi:hypothetical protein